jgi:polyvinyl alcohol dehydrogenase (cytochrome)
MHNISGIFVSAVLFLGLVTTAQAGSAQQSEGEVIFGESCAECHSSAQSGRTPSVFSLSSLSPRAIVSALENGVMQSEGAALSRDQRIMVAEALTNRRYSETTLPAAAFCSEQSTQVFEIESVSWMGFGGNIEGTGFQPDDRAGLTASEIPSLELLWAFAFPDASEIRTKPTIVGKLALFGDQFGMVYAVDTNTGCVRWTFEADAGIRGAILVDTDDNGRPLAYFVDFRTNAYALDIYAGTVVWKERVGWHPESNNTGSPTLYGNRLFVPISSMEVVMGGDPSYECCTSSGAVAALDKRTGELLWYHRVIPGYPEEAGLNALGTQLWAPSGAPVWSSPTIDLSRGRIYVGTGENYTRPTTATSDAIIAIEMETGEIAWSFQGTESDAFTMACTGFLNRQNCPAPPGPDHDFGMAPILVTREDGRDILVVGQKSGMVWALDPDADGDVLWSTRVGKGSALGGIHWGMASDGYFAYAANADRDAVVVDVHPGQEAAPGLYALDLMTGDIVWSAPAPRDTCEERQGCYPANSAAPTVIPGAVFAGGLDGHIRAYSTSDGQILWDFDTVQEFETSNGIRGKGGSIDGPGPVIANGLVFVNSGYGQFGQMPGNLLLVFGVPDN